MCELSHAPQTHTRTHVACCHVVKALVTHSTNLLCRQRKTNPSTQRVHCKNRWRVCASRRSERASSLVAVVGGGGSINNGFIFPLCVSRTQSGADSLRGHIQLPVAESPQKQIQPLHTAGIVSYIYRFVDSSNTAVAHRCVTHRPQQITRAFVYSLAASTHPHTHSQSD